MIPSICVLQVPNHPLWKRVLLEIQKRQLKHPTRGVMYITGPRMLTSVSEEWERSRWEIEFNENDGDDVYILHHSSNDNRLVSIQSDAGAM